MAEVPTNATLDIIQPGFIADVLVMEGIPGDTGPPGPTGPTGPANTLTIGTVTEGTPADASITGTAPTQTLNLTLPPGPEGPPGPGDVDGPASSTTDNVALYADTTGKLLKDGGTVVSNVPAASTTVQGKVELATNAETVTGTDTDRATTPAGVDAALDARVVDASETVKGIVELATVAEVATGTDTARAVTPAGAAGAYARSTLGAAEKKAVASGTSGTVTLDCSAASCFSLSPTGNVTTLTLSNPPASGIACTITLKVVQGATPRTIATPSGGIFMGAATPTQVANKTCIFTYYTDDGGTVWHCSAAVQV